MEWVKAGKNEWRLSSPDFEGTAVLNQTNEGYIALVRVEEKQFDMELLNDREFFEKEEEAMEFLRDRMDRDSY
ncbi:MAG: hypothetical protein MUP63_01385 [Candidatus Nanohaloarchaeota archaeon QJJ-7]|nr:hypothetical protein [Candidatus Nanohaloarchaeota archaeon QJJ-7]